MKTAYDLFYLVFIKGSKFMQNDFFYLLSFYGLKIYIYLHININYVYYSLFS